MGELLVFGGVNLHFPRGWKQHPGGGFVDPSQDADLFGSWMFSDDMARAQTLVHKLILGSLVFLSNIVNNLRFL